MKKIGVIFVSMLLTSCFWGEEAHEEYRLVDDLWLVWWADQSDAKLLCTLDEGERFDGGMSLVGSTVFAAAASDDFVLLKRHPNRIEEIHERLWGTWEEPGWRIGDLRDTLYLTRHAPGDSIFRCGDHWYHNVSGWTPPDSLRNPYRRVTLYYILDLRAVRVDTVSRYSALQRALYEYSTEDAFREARRSFGVPDTLDFRFKIDGME